ncbi:MAG: hypothetical protein GX909_04395 [Clostridiaceae bacterium]|nr:hypothetical protein [Clostridiaceae bacterium]
MKLNLDFYQRDALTVAPDLSKIFVHQTKEDMLIGRIVEMEAYTGKEDKGSHIEHEEYFQLKN